jgi:hypothetical protein
MFGGTVKATPLLAIAATYTTTLPVVAPAGTGTTMLVALQLVIGKDCALLNTTTSEPGVNAPKPVPVIVTEVPTSPEVGVMLVMLGGRTVKATALLATLLTVTTTLPVVVVGTVATMLVALQLVVAAPIPLNVTVLVP